MFGKSQTISVWNWFLISICIEIFQNVIINVNGDRGSFVGCYHHNLYFKRSSIFSGSSDVCIVECESLYYRSVDLKEANKKIIDNLKDL